MKKNLAKWIESILFRIIWITHYPGRHATMPMTNGQRWCPLCLRAWGRAKPVEHVTDLPHLQWHKPERK